jgi:C4-type Zn-finger protein
LDVKPTELSKQEIEHIEGIVSMFERDSEYLYEITHNEMAKSKTDFKLDPPVILED